MMKIFSVIAMGACGAQQLARQANALLLKPKASNELYEKINAGVMDYSMTVDPDWILWREPTGLRVQPRANYDQGSAENRHDLDKSGDLYVWQKRKLRSRGGLPAEILALLGAESQWVSPLLVQELSDDFLKTQSMIPLTVSTGEKIYAEKYNVIAALEELALLEDQDRAHLPGTELFVEGYKLVNDARQPEGYKLVNEPQLYELNQLDLWSRRKGDLPREKLTWERIVATEQDRAQRRAREAAAAELRTILKKHEDSKDIVYHLQTVLRQEYLFSELGVGEHMLFCA